MFNNQEEILITPKKNTIMGKFIISKRTNDEFQFNLKASNGEIILSSEGYKTKVSCKNGIESVMKNAPTATIVDETEQ